MGFPFLIRKGRFLPILFASTRAKPLDAACNPLGPPRRGNSGWDSPFSSRPIRNAGVSLSREAEALGCRGQSSQTKSRAADDGTERSRGNGQRESRLGFLFFFRKKPLSSNFIRSGKGEAFGCRVQSTRPAAQRNFRLGFPVFFRPIHNGGMSLSRGLKPLDTAGNPPRRSPVLPTAARDEAEATGRGNPGWDSPLSYSKRPLSSNFIRSDKGEALGCRAQSTRPAAQRKFRLGFPVFFLSYAKRWRVAFEGGCSPWMPRAILPDEVPCCRRRHETKQRR